MQIALESLFDVSSVSSPCPSCDQSSHTQLLLHLCCQARHQTPTLAAAVIFSQAPLCLSSARSSLTACSCRAGPGCPGSQPTTLTKHALRRWRMMSQRARQREQNRDLAAINGPDPPDALLPQTMIARRAACYCNPSFANTTSEKQVEG